MFDSKRSTLKFQHTVHSNLCWGKVFSSFEGRLRVKPATLRFIFGGVQLFPQDSIEISGVCGGDTIDISKEQRCGKFAICVMPASQTQGVRTVSLSLTPEWSFSRTMPVTPSTSMPTGNRAEWSVDIKLDDISPDGVSATKPAYLFWEAKYVAIHFRRDPCVHRVPAPIPRLRHPSHSSPQVQANPSKSNSSRSTLLPLT